MIKLKHRPIPGKPILGIFIITAILMSSAACSKCSSKKEQQEHRKGMIQSEEMLIPQITEIKLDPPEPVSTHNLRARVLLKDTNPRGLKYSYRWFIDGDEVSNNDRSLLENRLFKKGDKVYCEAVVLRGRHQSDPARSEKITIGNARPVVILTPVQPFSVPGRFSYQIRATDPDGDELSYHLVSPSHLGIDIHPETGVISWDIPELPKEDENVASARPEDESAPPANTRRGEPGQKEQEMGKEVKIVFEVRDNDGAVVKSEIVLNLEQGGEVPQ